MTQQKEKITWCQNQIIILQSFSQKIILLLLILFINNRNKKKTEILMNKSVHLGFSVLELSKILMHEC